MNGRTMKKMALAMSLALATASVSIPEQISTSSYTISAKTPFSLTNSTSSWSGGFSTNFTLKNDMSEGIEGWKLFLKRGSYEITSMWCATYELKDDYYVIEPEIWALNLNANGSVSFGFNGTGSLTSIPDYKVEYKKGGKTYTYDNTGSVKPTETVSPSVLPSKSPVITSSIKPSVTPTQYSGNNLEINISKDCSLGTYSSDFTKNGFTFITGGASWVIDNCNKSYNGVSYTSRAKSGGKGSVTKRAVKFTTNSAGTFTVLAMSGGSSNRNLTLSYDGLDVKSLTTLPNVISELTFSLPSSGTYVLYPSDDNVSIFSMKVSDKSNPTIKPTATMKPTATVKPTITVKPTATLKPTVSVKPSVTPIPSNQVKDGHIYVSPNGTGTGTSSSDPMSFEKALTTIKPGKTIYCLSGTYSFNKQITIAYGNNGAEGKYKTIRPYNGAVTFDFSKQSYGDPDSNQRGIQLEGDYWHLYDIKVTGAADNGMLLAGSHNIIEKCQFDGNRDTGLQISRRKSSVTNFADWPSYNLVKNSTSCNNMDPATGENADGFAAKLTCGAGNVFDGCISYNNVDDGWDLYAKSATGPIGVVTIKNCIAFRNGETSKGVFTPNSDGNGFKLGGAGVGTPHVVTNCIAFENRNHGFTDNNNPTGLQISNCTSFNNAREKLNLPPISWKASYLTKPTF